MLEFMSRPFPSVVGHLPFWGHSRGSNIGDRRDPHNDPRLQARLSTETTLETTVKHRLKTPPVDTSY